MLVFESFFLAFALVFSAEFADKTQLACISLVARYPKQSTGIFFGAVTAFFFVTLIGVITGYLLRITLPISVITVVAGIVFIGVGLYPLYNAKKQGKGEEREEFVKNQDNNREGSYFFKSFTLIALMEMGDKTQLIVISLAATLKSPFLVFLGAFIALAFITFLGVKFGKYITQKISKEKIETGSAIIFIILGIALIISQIPV